MLPVNGEDQRICFLSRPAIQDNDWNDCVAASPYRLVYGYTWYLDIVCERWAGLVVKREPLGYEVVLPVPLRQKRVAGFSVWVVQQPLFCQFLAVFSRKNSVDPTPFFRVMQQQFRYGSGFCSLQLPADSALQVQSRQTHWLDLSADYETIRQRYTRDRQVNLRRAEAAGWTLAESTDSEPLMQLFGENHAPTIRGGVANSAYEQLRQLCEALRMRKLARLQYAIRQGQIEAGALFVQEGNRIIYLFNAASAAGRHGNARTLLIDRQIRRYAGQSSIESPLWFDFESPDKPSIAAFYKSFGALEISFWTVRYQRLNWLEKTALALIRPGR